MASPLRTYVGALHVHRCEGEDGATFEDMLQAARRHQIDFVVLADNEDQPLDGLEGWHNGVLVLRAVEIRCPDGHLVACELRDPLGPCATVAEAVARVREQRGSIIAIHQHGQYAPSPMAMPGSVSWDDAEFLELWCFSEEWHARVSPHHVAQALSRPERLIHGPPRSLLRRWDETLETRFLPAVSGLNVLPQKQPFFDWKVFFTYDQAFQTVCTCLPLPELPSVSLRARDLVWSALRAGRGYLVNRGVAPEDNFLFTYQPKKGRLRTMGETIVDDQRGRFQIEVPDDADIVLRRNGQPLYWGSGRALGFPAIGPGSYRLEVYLNRRLWILTNPIMLASEDTARQPTVSNFT